MPGSRLDGMRKMNDVTTPIATAAVLSTLSCAFAQQCPAPPFQPVPEGDAYIDTYAGAVPVSEEIHRTAPDLLPFERLRVMDPTNAGPIDFTGWTRDPDTGGLEETDVTI